MLMLHRCRLRRWKISWLINWEIWIGNQFKHKMLWFDRANFSMHSLQAPDKRGSFSHPVLDIWSWNRQSGSDGQDEPVSDLGFPLVRHPGDITADKGQARESEAQLGAALPNLLSFYLSTNLSVVFLLFPCPFLRSPIDVSPNKTKKNLKIRCQNHCCSYNFCIEIA